MFHIWFLMTSWINCVELPVCFIKLTKLVWLATKTKMRFNYIRFQTAAKAERWPNASTNTEAVCQWSARWSNTRATGVTLLTSASRNSGASAGTRWRRTSKSTVVWWTDGGLIIINVRNAFPVCFLFNNYLYCFLLVCSPITIVCYRHKHFYHTITRLIKLNIFNY